MSELLHEFEQGEYGVLEFRTKAEEDKVVIDINDGDLGRLPIESVETIEKLREALESAESHLKEKARRQEDLGQ
ncbi:MAG: hypothetical protein ABEK01_02070 [Candidatus Nanohaloarchaea archaeon]